MPSLKSLYPKAWENRLSHHHPLVKKGCKPFFIALGTNFLYLQILFLGLFAYIFGALFQQTSHTHNLSIAFVDYDGGAIGRAVRGAYSSLQGEGFPSLIERSPSEIETTTDLLQAVCQTKYWGALYVTQGASARLQEALAGSTAASAYDNSDVMAYIWNQAVYAPVVDPAISANLQLLSNTARVVYSTGNGTGNIQSVSGAGALSVLADPWKLQSINIQPTSQGSRAIYNTVVIILILIQEFFYLGTLNGLYGQFKLYARLDPYRIIAVRNLTSLAYTFVGSICVVSMIWAFKSDWNVNGNQYALTWIALWLFAHANFLTLDVFTIWLPAPFVPMALVSWIIFNVTSVILPFELSPGFYQLGYIFPAHEVYQVLTHIWSRGCNPQLHYALPVLFTWELAAFLLSALGVFRRCHFSTIGEELQAREFKERVDVAVEFEMSRKNTKMQKSPKPLRVESEEEPKETPSELDGSRTEDDEEAMRDELAGIIQRVNTKQQRELEKMGTACNFGPSFNVPFNHESEDEE